MIRFEKTRVVGFHDAIRGMRNPMNSWDKSDSEACAWCQDIDICHDCSRDCDTCPHERNYDYFCLGNNDRKLALKLASAGPVHGKFRRMIVVYTDIIAPFYWWKEFDTYKVGTVANSCSTMHTIHTKEFVEGDFSFEYVLEDEMDDPYASAAVGTVLSALNRYRELYLETGNKKYWYKMIQLLPNSYNQRRTIMFNYEVLSNIYIYRGDHKLDEWREDFCKWIEKLPYSEIITCGVKGENND